MKKNNWLLGGLIVGGGALLILSGGGAPMQPANISGGSNPFLMAQPSDNPFNLFQAPQFPDVSAGFGERSLFDNGYTLSDGTQIFTDASGRIIGGRTENRSLTPEGAQFAVQYGGIFNETNTKKANQNTRGGSGRSTRTQAPLNFTPSPINYTPIPDAQKDKKAKEVSEALKKAGIV